jgi:hypothetical protein
MKKDTTYVARDDSKNSIVVGVLRPEAMEPELRQIPNEPRQLRWLFERLKREGPVVTCYEAGPAGYDLDRQLTTLGVPCQVIAPALTPRKPYRGTVMQLCISLCRREILQLVLRQHLLPVERDYVAHLRKILELRAVAVVVAWRPGQTSGGRAGDLGTLVTSPKDA